MTTTETLGYDDAVAWAYSHTGHFTNEPSKALLLRLASAVTPQYRCVQWLSQHNEDITVTYNRDTGDYTCEATPRGTADLCPLGCDNPDCHYRTDEPAGTALLRELRHSRGIDG